MTRELKFRAWLKEEKRMVMVDGIQFGLGLVDYIDEPAPDGPTSIENCELMQYTGLKDKNDKEIYEGDIILFENDYTENYFDPPEPNNDFGIVVWSATRLAYEVDATQFRYNKNRDISLFEEVYGTDCEVIGNIYKNPELMDPAL